MSDPVAHFQIVTRHFADGLELAQCHGFPGLTCLSDLPGRAATDLQAKILALIESAHHLEPGSLHRRVSATAGAQQPLSLEIPPPAHRLDWQQPVQLTFDYLLWSETDDLHLGYLPALDLLITATKPEQIPERLQAHARILLLDRRRHLLLRDLAQAQLTRHLEVAIVPIETEPCTARERLQAAAGEEKKASVLEKVATKLPTKTKPQAFEYRELLTKLRDLLESRRPASVLLVGPPGAGKSALVRELARHSPRPVWSTSGSRLIAGQSGFGDWQEQCRDLMREAGEKKAILHLGSLAELLEVGQHCANSQTIASFMRPSIARGEILAIAECTPEQWSLIDQRDPHVAGAFTILRIPEPSAEKARRILELVLEQWRPAPDPALQPALDWLHRLHLRYATYSANPGRPIRFLTNLLANTGQLSIPAVTAAFTRETGLPEVLLRDDCPLDLDRTRDWFTARVVAQPDAVSAVVDLLATIKARLNRPRQPLGAFLFAGPTGTGKTELAKALAEFLFGSLDRLARFDLGQCGDPIAVQRLIGGIDRSEGLLTARVREQPFSVLLLDEFEKADPMFFDLLLQVLGDGRLTDAAGRVADFSNCVIIMTSNLGAREFQQGAIGFPTDREASATRTFTTAVRQFLRPEIYNRLGAVVPFRALSRERMLEITRRQLELLQQRDGIRLGDVALQLGPDVEEWLATRGYDPLYGARPLKRALERWLVTPLAETLNVVRHDRPLQAQVRVVPEAGRLKIEVSERLGRTELAGARRQRELIESIADLRRRMQKLAASQTVIALENEVPMLALLERRQAREEHLDPRELAALARLGFLRAELDRLQVLGNEVNDWETELLCEFHVGNPIDETAARNARDAFHDRRRQLQLGLFRLMHPILDRVLIALYSEDREWLLTLIQLYLDHARALGGELQRFEYILPPEASGAEPRRKEAADPARPLEKKPDNWVGIIMQWKGDLFTPRFEPEAGLHIRKNKRHLTLCLVETGTMPPDQYIPPTQIHRAGTIHDKLARHRRIYQIDEDKIVDSELPPVTCNRHETAIATRELIEARLEKAIEDLA